MVKLANVPYKFLTPLVVNLVGPPEDQQNNIVREHQAFMEQHKVLKFQILGLICIIWGVATYMDYFGLNPSMMDSLRIFLGVKRLIQVQTGPFEGQNSSKMGWGVRPSVTNWTIMWHRIA